MHEKKNYFSKLELKKKELEKCHSDISENVFER